MSGISLCFHRADFFLLLLSINQFFFFAYPLIQSPPRITKQPPPDELLFQVALRQDENDKPFIIECEAEGEPDPKYQWQKNGKVFEWQTYDNRMSQQPGRGTLVITSPRDEDLGTVQIAVKNFICCAGYYQCFAVNEWGKAMSNSVHVRKSELSSFKHEEPKIERVSEGQPFHLNCQPPDGYPKPENSDGTLRSINSSRMTVDPEGTLWFSNITRQDSSTDFLYACSATSLFRNEYKVGNKVQLYVQTIGRSSDRNKHPPTPQYISRKNFVAERGSKAELWCIHGGTPLPEIQWSKKGEQLTWDRYSLTNYGKTLVINAVDFVDEGIYECIASNGVGYPQSHAINVRVEAKPYFTKEPELLLASEGEEAIFTCEANGVPRPIIQWYYNGQLLSESTYNPRRTLVGDNTIIISNIIKSDTGNYACNASNSLGYAFKDVSLNVLALPPSIIVPPQNIQAVDGQNVVLNCEVFGAPKPEVRWIRAGQELTGGRYIIQEKGNLIINGATFIDSGEYTCFAKNKFGNISTSGSLVIKEKTKIKNGPEDYEVAAGSTATFRCIALADPSLTLNIVWLNKGENIDFFQEPRFMQSSDGSLTITKTTELDSGVYTCLAKTTLDSAEAHATLIVQDVPNAPRLLSVQCNDKDATIEWEPQGDNRAPILYYTVEYNTSFSPDSWKIAFDNAPPTVRNLKIGMSPWANYTFRVIVHNKIGPSPPSQYPSQPCETPGDVPFNNPANVEGRGTRPDNLVISWTPMPEIEHNGPGFLYVVHWKRDKPGENWNIQQIRDWRTSRYIVQNLPTFQRFLVKIKAQNNFGQSKLAAEVITCYSGEDIPTEAPFNFTLVEVVDATTAAFSWDHVNPSSLRGHFRGYKLQTWAEQDGEQKMQELKVESTSNTAVVQKLVPFSINKARVMAFNGQYNGPFSDILTFRTPQGKPGPVDSFEAVPMGSSALLLIWNKPKQPNGILTGYRIYYQTVVDTHLGPLMERLPPVSNPDTTRAKLAGLKPGTKYRITIRPTTEVGQGTELFIEESTRNVTPRPPDKPHFAIDHMPSLNGLAAVIVRWIPQGQNLGSHFFVQYRLRGDPIFLSTEEEMNEDYIILRGLTPSALYEFRVIAIDGEHSAESDIEEFQTWSQSGSPLMQQHDDLSSAGWFVGMLVAIALLLLVLIIVCIIKRNRGGKYHVYEREVAQGGDIESTKFDEYNRPLTDDKNSHASFSSTKTSAESESDSMAEYGDGETEGMNEDGSFIGQYGHRITASNKLPGTSTLV